MKVRTCCDYHFGQDSAREKLIEGRNLAEQSLMTNDPVLALGWIRKAEVAFRAARDYEEATKAFIPCQD